MSFAPQDVSTEQGNSLQAALARTVTRTMALYFSRPVRLFRPSKVSGWASLRSLASRDGASLSPQYITALVRQQGVFVIPRHFIPPSVVNIALGTVLWTTYAETSSFLEAHLAAQPFAVSAISGGVAGGAQALVAAPAENVRLLLEGGSSFSGWSGAWRNVFLGAQPELNPSRDQIRRDARQVRAWMKEVSDMAGRGWNGWGWGCAKDVFGFAIFFSIFEVTRGSAASLKKVTVRIIDNYVPTPLAESSVTPYIPRVMHGVWLVGGGVCAGLAYELTGRPWDIARRAVYLQRISRSSGAETINTPSSIARILSNKLREEGVLSFFRNTYVNADAEALHNKTPRGVYAVMRTLARVGPWGVGFLAWEAFGPGLAA